MSILEEWANDVIARPSLEIKDEIIVEGVRKKHLGPRLEYAVIKLKMEPSTEFEVEFSESLSSIDQESKELLYSAIYGVLDVIMVNQFYPLKNIKLSFLKADIHPIDSNKNAFRNAGRDAGMKIMENLCVLQKIGFK